MSRIASSIFAAIIGLGAAGLGTASVQAADLPVYSDNSAYSGLCGNAWVLNRITSRFSHQVRHVPNLPQVGISNFQRIYASRYEPANEDHPIGRTYCGATVTLSDGRDRSIWYLVEEGMGFASIGDNVEFCVAGFDRWYVYNGGYNGDQAGCRVLR